MSYPDFISVPIVIYESTEHEWEEGSEEQVYQPIRIDSIISWWPTDRERDSWPDLRCVNIEYEGGTVVADMTCQEFTELMEDFRFEVQRVATHNEGVAA